MAQVSISVHVFLAYPMPLNPVSLAIEGALGIDKMEGKKELTARVICRTCLVLSTIVIALAVPYFGPILNLTSALATCSLVFILPPTFYFLISRKNSVQLPPWELFLLVLSLMLGLFGSGFGTYSALEGLISQIKLNPNPFGDFWGV